MKVLIVTALIFLCSPVFAADKCLNRNTLKSLYAFNMKYIENFGHILAMNLDKYDRESGYIMDVYAQKKVPVKDKVTKGISHYKNCLMLVKKGIQGKYIYGTFSKSGLEIKLSEGTRKRISFKD